MSDRPLLVEPVPALAFLPPYVIGRPERGVDLVLDFNESLAAPPSLAPELCRYPPLRPALEAAIGALLGVDGDRVAVTCGADDALQRVVQAVACPGRRVVLTLPSYGMLQRYTRIAGAELVEVPWWSGELPVAALVAAAGDGPALVAVVSPNNPTGLAASAAAVAALIERLPRALILVDQAYVDFVDPGYDLADLVQGLGGGRAARRLRRRRRPGGRLAAPGRPALPGVAPVGHGRRRAPRRRP